MSRRLGFTCLPMAKLIIKKIDPRNRRRRGCATRWDEANKQCHAPGVLVSSGGCFRAVLFRAFGWCVVMRTKVKSQTLPELIIHDATVRCTTRVCTLPRFARVRQVMNQFGFIPPQARKSAKVRALSIKIIWMWVIWCFDLFAPTPAHNRSADLAGLYLCEQESLNFHRWWVEMEDTNAPPPSLLKWAFSTLYFFKNDHKSTLCVGFVANGFVLPLKIPTAGLGQRGWILFFRSKYQLKGSFPNQCALLHILYLKIFCPQDIFFRGGWKNVHAKLMSTQLMSGFFGH